MLNNPEYGTKNVFGEIETPWNAFRERHPELSFTDEQLMLFARNSHDVEHPSDTTIKARKEIKWLPRAECNRVKRNLFEMLNFFKLAAFEDRSKPKTDFLLWPDAASPFAITGDGPFGSLLERRLTQGEANSIATAMLFCDLEASFRAILPLVFPQPVMRKMNDHVAVTHNALYETIHSDAFLEFANQIEESFDHTLYTTKQIDIEQDVIDNIKLKLRDRNIKPTTMATLLKQLHAREAVRAKLLGI